MSLSLRRVVTGHDEKGKAVVLIDEIMNDARSMRPNHQGLSLIHISEPTRPY